MNQSYDVSTLYYSFIIYDTYPFDRNYLFLYDAIKEKRFLFTHRMNCLAAACFEKLQISFQMYFKDIDVPYIFIPIQTLLSDEYIEVADYLNFIPTFVNIFEIYLN